MSDTKKTRDAAAREGRTAREAMEQAEDIGRQATEDFRAVGESVADTMARTTDAAVEMGQRAAEQSREVMLLGIRAAAGMNGRLADASYGASRALGATARVLKICQQAGDDTAEHLEALFSACLTMGRGMQQIQRTYLEMLDQTVNGAAHKQRDMVHCKSIEDIVELQRDLYLDAVNRAVGSSTMLLQIAMQTAQQAMRPLQARSHRG